MTNRYRVAPLPTLSEDAVFEQFVSELRYPGHLHMSPTASHDRVAANGDALHDDTDTVTSAPGAVPNLWLRLLQEEPRVRRPSVEGSGTPSSEDATSPRRASKKVTWRQCISGASIDDDVGGGGANDLPPDRQTAFKRRSLNRRVSEVISTYVCDLTAENIAYRVPIPQPAPWERARDAIAARLAAFRSSDDDDDRSSTGEVQRSAGEAAAALEDDEAGLDDDDEEEELSEEDMRYRDILFDVSVEVPAGQMVAVLGGSGGSLDDEFQWLPGS